jgi:hypothetical protein
LVANDRQLRLAVDDPPSASLALLEAPTAVVKAV